MIKKQSIIKRSSNNSKSHAFIVLGDSEVIYFWKGRIEPSVNFFITFHLLIVLHSKEIYSQISLPCLHPEEYFEGLQLSYI